VCSRVTKFANKIKEGGSMKHIIILMIAAITIAALVQCTTLHDTRGPEKMIMNWGGEYD